MISRPFLFPLDA